MIAFDLLCGSGHQFEGWFRSSADYDVQVRADDIPCPVCGNRDIRKAAMSPNVARKGNQSKIGAPKETQPLTAPALAPSAGTISAAAGDVPPQIRALAAALAEAQAAALPKSTWVGDAFAARARAMHQGEEPEALIHGQATAAEAEALVDDGIAIMPLLVPVVPPELKN